MPSLLSFLLLSTTLLAVPSVSRTLFAYERKVLTQEYVNSLPEGDQYLFAFDNTSAAPNKSSTRCRYGPNDGKWPSDKAWTKLSKQLSSVNTLIQTTPQASICYGSTKDDAKCAALTSNWTNSYAHIDDPTEILSPIYQGLTCQPPTIYDSGNCTLGGYPSYVIKAQDVLDLQLGINFARNNGIRLVIKNTGHDFAGKSTGAGSLGLWTHGLKDLLYFDAYVDPTYTGPAIKAGAGVETIELYKFAHDHGVMAVAGEGQTVGVTGGYILGGGHSPLSSLYGMAADQVLGFEVVTPIGEFVTANSTSNTDLFWALRGGGGGTFGIVTSMTIKAFKDLPISAASWSITSSKIGNSKFWQAAQAFIDRAPTYADNGSYSYIVIAPTSSGTDYSFTVQPFFAPNKTINDTMNLLNPYFNTLTKLNIPVSPKVMQYTSFYTAWQAEFSLEVQSDVRTALGSRLFPRSNFASETGRNLTISVLRATVEAGGSIIAFNLAPTLTRGGNPDNSVNPAWRKTVLHAITGTKWDPKASPAQILAARASFTNGTMQKWRDITPGSGSYLNEADRLEPNWQTSFWGENYARLLQIKQDNDPKGVFWVVNGVGSEGWRVESVDGLPNENGKLCKVDGATLSSSAVSRPTGTGEACIGTCL